MGPNLGQADSAPKFIWKVSGSCGLGLGSQVLRGYMFQTCGSFHVYHGVCFGPDRAKHRQFHSSAWDPWCIEASNCKLTTLESIVALWWQKAVRWENVVAWQWLPTTEPTWAVPPLTPPECCYLLAIVWWVIVASSNPASTHARKLLLRIKHLFCLLWFITALSCTSKKSLTLQGHALFDTVVAVVLLLHFRW